MEKLEMPFEFSDSAARWLECLKNEKGILII